MTVFMAAPVEQTTPAAVPAPAAPVPAGPVPAGSGGGRARAAVGAIRAGLGYPDVAFWPLAAAGAAALEAHAQIPGAAGLDPQKLAEVAADLLGDLLHLATAVRAPQAVLWSLCDRHRLGALAPAVPADRTLVEGIAMCWNSVVVFLGAQGMDRVDALRVVERAHGYWAAETGRPVTPVA
jgi:hypothetical protein